jgi:hypothetical protein
VNCEETISCRYRSDDATLRNRFWSRPGHGCCRARVWALWLVCFGPYPYGPYLVANVGQVKLDTHVKEADVFIDGSYAGTLRDLKSMMMRPGNYDISVRAPRREVFEQKIYVVAGKTLKLRPELRVQSTPAPTVR